MSLFPPLSSYSPPLMNHFPDCAGHFHKQFLNDYIILVIPQPSLVHLLPHLASPSAVCDQRRAGKTRADSGHYKQPDQYTAWRKGMRAPWAGEMREGQAPLSGQRWTLVFFTLQSTIALIISLETAATTKLQTLLNPLSPLIKACETELGKHK